MMRDDRGSGSILAVAVIATVLGLVSLSTPLYVVLSAQQRAATAADAAALAGSAVALGIVPGVPCSVAAALARANGAKLSRCQSDSAVITVRVTVSAMGFTVPAMATAGPSPHRN